MAPSPQPNKPSPAPLLKVPGKPVAPPSLSSPKLKVPSPMPTPGQGSLPGVKQPGNKATPPALGSSLPSPSPSSVAPPAQVAAPVPAALSSIPTAPPPATVAPPPGLPGLASPSTTPPTPPTESPPTGVSPGQDSAAAVDGKVSKRPKQGKASKSNYTKSKKAKPRILLLIFDFIIFAGAVALCILILLN